MSKSSFEEELSRNGILCYTTSGVSMLPLLHQHRDLVVIEKPDGRLRKYDVALYKRSDGKYILHRIIKVRKNDYVICGDNCVRKEYGITDDHILGVMKEFVRNGKTCSADSAGYRVYSHIITDFYYIKAAILWNKRVIKKIIRKVWKHKNR